MGTRQSGKCQLFVYIFEKDCFGLVLRYSSFSSLGMYIFIYRCFFSLRECKKWPVILFAGTRIRDWVWGPTISARSTCTLSFLWPGVRHYQDVPMASLAWRPRWSLCAKRRGDHVEKSRKNISKMCPTVQSVPILRKTNNIRRYLLILLPFLFQGLIQSFLLHFFWISPYLENC